MLTRKKITHSICALALSLSLFSCSEEPAVKIELKDLCQETNVDKRFEVEGRAIMLTSMTVYVTTQKFVLKDKDNNTVYCDIQSGTGNNNMKELPEEFSEEDFEITDNDGKKIKAGDNIRVVGTLENVNPKYGACRINVDEIYKK